MTRAKIIHAADLFCGAGGTSTGLLNAANRLGLGVDLLAINHWKVAINTHQANHPQARHLATGLEAVTPAEVVPSGRLDILWASPSCTHHSVARGGKPRSNQLRAQPHLILDWVDQLYVKRLMIENVPAFTTWGPLDYYGKPIKSKAGVLFHDFLRSLEARGYRWDWRTLCCADYGDATTRERFFLQAVKGRGKIRWPEPTHARNPGGLFPQRPWVSAREIIDWDIPGTSIFRRKKPLAENTLKRIEAGIRKFWGPWAKPFLVILRGTGDRQLQGSCIEVDEPLPTITAGGGHVGLVEPFLTAVGQTGGGDRLRGINEPIPALVSKQEQCLCQPFIVPQLSCGANRGMDEPLPTITTAGAHALVQPFVLQVNNGATSENHACRVRGIDEPIGTQTASNTFGMCQPFIVSFYGQGKALSIEEPFATITTKDRFGLVQQWGLDILFRMLQPHELALAHSFPSSYHFDGTKTDIVKQIGNSVPSKTSEALCFAALAESA